MYELVPEKINESTERKFPVARFGFGEMLLPVKEATSFSPGTVVGFQLAASSILLPELPPTHTMVSANAEEVSVIAKSGYINKLLSFFKRASQVSFFWG